MLPHTDAALRLAITHIWITEGLYYKDYIAIHTVGFDKFRDYNLGPEGRHPQDARLGFSQVRRAGVDD